MWVGGFSPFFANNDLLVAWEFELSLQKEEDTFEHYGSWLFLLGFFLYYSNFFSFDDDATTFSKEGVVRKKTIFFAT